MKNSPGFCKQSIFGAIAVAMTLGSTSIAYAQDEDDEALDEIIVTAQFREQRLQDAPLAITAVTDVMMQQRSIDNVWQVARFSPNVSMVPMPGPFGSSMAAFIRGIGQDDFNFAREPGVGLYIDDVYFPTLTGSLFEVMDLERIEVLRGPQGTLQGRNSIGGAVRLIARKPTGDGPGYAEITTGSFSRISGKAGGEFSLSDTLSARVSGTFLAKDGYQDVLDFACYDPASAAANGISSSGIGSGDCVIGALGGRDYAAGRVHFRWQPNDTWDISLIGDLANDDSDINANTLISGETVPAAFPGPPGPQNAMPGYGNHFVPPNPYITFETFCDDNTNPLGTTSLTGPWCTEPINHLETWGLALTVDVDINDNLSFLSITSYREFVNEWATSTDGSPLAGETGWNDAVGESLQQEFRLQGAFGDAFDYTLGVFWFEQDNYNAARIDIPYAGTTPAFPFDFITDEDFESESLGIYAQGVFHLTDNFNITAGARYSDEEKNQVTRRLDPASGGTSASTIPPFLCADPVTFECGRNTFATDRVDYRVALDYRFNEGIMAYASYATGFKSGGVSPRYFFANQFIPYDEEEATGTEIGFKSDLAGNTLRLNGAYFFNTYDDQQLGSPVCPDLVPPAPCLADRNMVDAEISGFELEATWVPTDALLVDLSLSWIDNEFTRIDPNISPTFIQTSSVPEATPESKYNLGIQYGIPMASGAILTPRVDVIWQDEINGFNETRATTFDNSKPIPIEDYTLVNVRLNWLSPDGDWEISGALTNATDEEYFLSLFDLSSFGGWSGGMPGLPREWSLTLRRNFQ